MMREKTSISVLAPGFEGHSHLPYSDWESHVANILIFPREAWHSSGKHAKDLDEPDTQSEAQGPHIHQPNLRLPLKGA